MAADEKGNVYVAWHAPTDPKDHGEASRRVWLVSSEDEGKTFGAERLISDPATGVCGCCGMKLFVNARGYVQALYRGAVEVSQRDMYLATGKAMEPFSTTKVGEWKTGTCPMSTAAFARSSKGTIAAWEAQERVQFGVVGGGALKSPSGGGRQRFPAVAVNQKGDVLVAWAEGTGWNKGGTVAWEVYEMLGDGTFKANAKGEGKDLAVWSFPAAFAKKDGTFVVVY